jgi:hypothetical protein
VPGQQQLLLRWLQVAGRYLHQWVYSSKLLLMQLRGCVHSKSSSS